MLFPTAWGTDMKIIQTTPTLIANYLSPITLRAGTLLLLAIGLSACGGGAETESAPNLTAASTEYTGPNLIDSLFGMGSMVSTAQIAAVAVIIRVLAKVPLLHVPMTSTWLTVKSLPLTLQASPTLTCKILPPHAWSPRSLADTTAGILYLKSAPIPLLPTSITGSAALAAPHAKLNSKPRFPTNWNLAAVKHSQATTLYLATFILYWCSVAIAAIPNPPPPPPRLFSPTVISIWRWQR